DVLRLAAYGDPNRQIAAKLFIADGTVRNYLSRAITKTGGRTKVEAIRIAQAAGWLQPRTQARPYGPRQLDHRATRKPTATAADAAPTPRRAGVAVLGPDLDRLAIVRP
ncbi:MAG: hypothetical protein AVDCRST_MAG41-740, partial [uncultured Corynebacteriales bacterium]